MNIYDSTKQQEISMINKDKPKGNCEELYIQWPTGEHR